ncbi:MAG: hypothetical protein NXI24_10935 [bacterium]|nr:hypothetical protein [bacterium]
MRDEAADSDKRRPGPGRGSQRRVTGETRSLRSALFEGRYEEAFQKARDLREARGEGTDPGTLYAGACALFGLGHILQAEEWVEAHGARSKYRGEHLYLAAYIELHKDHHERALLYWTRIVQDDPSETFADALIDKLKRGEQRVRQELNQPGAFLRYVPLEAVDSHAGPGAAQADGTAPRAEANLRRSWLRWGTRTDDGQRDSRDGYWWLLAGIVLLSVLSIGFGAYLDEILGIFAPDPYSAVREDLPDVPAGGAVINPEAYADDAPRFLYPDKAAALTEYSAAREKIASGYPNQARYLLGRLELSNASFEIKERALLLRDAIPRVGPGDFRDPLDVASVIEEPYIYRDAQISWQGDVQNLRQSAEGLGFDLILPRGAAAGNAPMEGGSEDADLEAGNPGPRPSGQIVVQVLYLFRDRGADRPPELRDGQSARVFGSVVKAAGGRITVHAVEIE